MIDLEYFYNLNGMSMATNVDCFMIFLDRKGFGNYNDFVENGVSLEFLMQYVGKEEYLEYSDSINGHFCSNYKSYFFDDSSNKIIYFCFNSSLSQEFISSLLIENGDLDKWQNNKVYSVIVNEDFELAYTNYISNGNIFKK